MEPEKPNPEDLLLDWHLNRIDEQDRLWIERELQRDESLRARGNRLGRILQPLDHWTVPPAQTNLADKVLASVQHSTRGAERVLQFPVEEPVHRRLRFLSLKDALAVAACLLLLVGVFVPGASQIRSRSQRAMCAGNLASIFRGVSAYQDTFDGSLPFAGTYAGASWLPGGATGRPYASNSRHTYLLVKLNYGPSAADFICPANKTGVPMQAADFAAYNDFVNIYNVSYDSLNLAGESPNLRPPASVAYIGDTNPLFVGVRFDESVNPDKTNSPAHRGRGQTVITLDGSTRWMTTPIYGSKRDNLWLAGRIRRYTGVETRASDDDVQLVPGYPATDPTVCRALAH